MVISSFAAIVYKHALLDLVLFDVCTDCTRYAKKKFCYSLLTIHVII